MFRVIMKHFARIDGFRLLLIWVIGIIVIGLTLVVPIEVGRLTNSFAQPEPPPWSFVRRAVLYIAGSQLALCLAGYVRRRNEVELQEKLTRGLTLDVYSRILRFSPEFFRSTEIEKINSRALEDTNKVSTVWVPLLTGMPVALFSIVAFGAVMILSNWFLGIIMVPLSLLSGYFVLFDRRIQATNRRARDTWDAIRAHAHETIASVGELRSHYAFDYGLSGLRKSFNDFQETMSDIGRLTAVFQAMNPLTMCLQTSTLFWIGATLSTGAALGFAGRMSWGSVIEFAFIVQLFQRPVSQAGEMLLQWRLCGESSRRVLEYMSTPCVWEPSSAVQLLPQDTTIKFRNVTVAAPTGSRILGVLTAAITPGQHVAFCGPAGCGKSTALNLITRNTSASAGTVEMGGVAVEDVDVVSAARRIGFVPQTPVILNTTIRNNLLLGLRRSAERSLEDDGWPLDVTTRQQIYNLEDLNRELLLVLRQVGLEMDVFGKAMDAPLSTWFETAARSTSAFTDTIMNIRRTVVEEVRSAGNNLSIPFNVNTYLPGTIADNILGPAAYGKDKGKQLADDVIGLCQHQDSLRQLIALGQYRVRTDRSLAVGSLARSPMLASFLRNRNRADEVSTSALDESATHVPEDVQRLFLQIALESDADLINEGCVFTATNSDEFRLALASRHL